MPINFSYTNICDLAAHCIKKKKKFCILVITFSLSIIIEWIIV